MYDKTKASKNNDKKSDKKDLNMLVKALRDNLKRRKQIVKKISDDTGKSSAN